MAESFGRDMKKYFLCVFIFLFNLTVLNSSYSCEIHFKSGRIIKTTNRCWEEDNFVCYQKFDSTVRIKKSLVKKIAYNTIKKRKNSTIYFKNGGSKFCREIAIADGQARCGTGTSLRIYPANNIDSIVEGKNHLFLDLPESAQRKFGEVTIFTKNHDPILSNCSWREKDKLYCDTSSGRLILNVEDIIDVKKGSWITKQKEKEAIADSSKIIYFKIRKKLIVLNVPLEIGQEKAAVFKYTGKPESINKKDSGSGKNYESWHFDGGYILFQNGKLTTIAQN